MSEIEAIVETAIYVDDLDAAEAFYRDVLGLEVIGKEAGRHVFFRVGDGVLLAFDPEATLRGDMLPPHGARGPGHFALGVRAEALDEWRRRLEGHGVAVEKEVDLAQGRAVALLPGPGGQLGRAGHAGLWGLPGGGDAVRGGRPAGRWAQRRCTRSIPHSSRTNSGMTRKHRPPVGPPDRLRPPRLLGTEPARVLP